LFAHLCLQTINARTNRVIVMLLQFTL